jgi:hypothetical protein
MNYHKQKKAVKFKAPQFYMKTHSGGVYYKLTWHELLEKLATFKRYGYDAERINKLFMNYDVYGSQKPQTIDRLLNRRYDRPEDVPIELYLYIYKHKPILTTDATDAVRWSRIINSKDEERYPAGEMYEIFRAVEKYREIRPGDWVSTDENYAIEHNERNLGNKGNIISMVVDGKDLLVSPTGNYEEAIYAPLELSIDVDVWRN